MATVEAAITLPLLLFLLLATAELGRAFFQYNALTKAVRDSARFVAGSRANSTGVFNLTNEQRLVAQRLVVFGDPSGMGDALLPGLAVEDVTVADAGGGYVSVAAEFAFTPMIASDLPGFGITDPIALEFPMRAEVVMRML